LREQKGKGRNALTRPAEMEQREKRVILLALENPGKGKQGTPSTILPGVIARIPQKTGCDGQGLPPTFEKGENKDKLSLRASRLKVEKTEWTSKRGPL